MKSLRNLKRRPTYPGAILREDVLPALKMTQTELAQRLGISRLSVSELLHEKRGMTPEMAMRVAKLLNTTPESWLTSGRSKRSCWLLEKNVVRSQLFCCNMPSAANSK